MTTMSDLTAARKADRETMAHRVVDLASEYRLAAWHRPEEAGTRRTSVDLASPHGLKLTVTFDGSTRELHRDVYVLSWYGVEDGTRLHPGMFGNVNPYHGHKATDVARGFAQLERTLRERFAVIRDGSAFVPA